MTVAGIIRDHVDVAATPRSIEDPAVVRGEMVDPSGQVTLESMVEWMWYHGVPVIPLHGNGRFYAAVLAVGSEPTVTAKETRDQSRTGCSTSPMNSVTSHLGRTCRGPSRRYALIPTGDVSHDTQESAANEYALSLLLDNEQPLARRRRPKTHREGALQRRLTSTIESELDRLLVQATVFSD